MQGMLLPVVLKTPCGRREQIMDSEKQNDYKKF